MLEKPSLADERITAGLWDSYGLACAQVEFLPLGADQDTAVYRLVTEGGTSYFLKLRRGPFNPLAVELARYISDRGIGHIIAPLPARTGQLWAGLDAFTAILSPFIEGHDGYQVALSVRQWAEFGSTLKAIHTVFLPSNLAQRLPHETYSPLWRQMTRKFVAQVEGDPFNEPVAAKLAAFLKVRRLEVLDLVERAERYAGVLQNRPLAEILCHSDLHAGNVLICANGDFYIVDWDDALLAPRERDLMFFGGGQGFLGHTPHEEEALFYRGYGTTQIDPLGLAYYRYERIVQDIALFCDQILSTDEGGEDREQSFQYLTSNFLPGGTIEIAYTFDTALGDGQALI